MTEIGPDTALSLYTPWATPWELYKGVIYPLLSPCRCLNYINYHLAPPHLFIIQLIRMTNSYVIPEECRAAVVVNEGPNFTIKTQMVKVPVPGNTIQ